MISLQLLPLANTAAFFCSLLGLVSNSFLEVDSGSEISTPWHCVEEINHLRNSWLVLRNNDLFYKPAFHAYRTTLGSFFHAYSPSWKCSLFLEKHSAVLSWTNKLNL